MKIVQITPEQIEWLKENYPITTDHNCRLYLHIGYKRLWMLVEQYGLKKRDLTEKEKEERSILKLQKNVAWCDINNKGGYCIDCVNYRTDGICWKMKKPIGALWKKKCFKREA